MTRARFLSSLNISISPLEEISGTPSTWIRSLLDVVGSGTDGQQWQCPAHRDSTPSLGVDTGRNGAALVHCLAGCPIDEILAALALRPAHLFAPPDCAPAEHARAKALRWRLRFPPLVLPRSGSDPTERLVAVHDYGPDYRLERWRSSSDAKRRLVWFRRDDRGAWIPGLGGRLLGALPLYREHHVGITAATGDPLFVVESESSVDALEQAGHYGTTWAGGASTPPLAKLATALAGVPDVRVVADHDEPGIRCAHVVLAAVPHASGWVPPTPGHDVRDLLATDRNLATLQPIGPSVASPCAVAYEDRS
jgi:hypothetical protein